MEVEEDETSVDEPVNAVPVHQEEVPDRTPSK
jgi:hypothetical protein